MYWGYIHTGFEGFTWKTIGDSVKNDTPKTDILDIIVFFDVNKSKFLTLQARCCFVAPAKNDTPYAKYIKMQLYIYIPFF